MYLKYFLKTLFAILLSNHHLKNTTHSFSEKNWGFISYQLKNYFKKMLKNHDSQNYNDLFKEKTKDKQN